MLLVRDTLTIIILVYEKKIGNEFKCCWSICSVLFIVIGYNNNRARNKIVLIVYKYVYSKRLNNNTESGL